MDAASFITGLLDGPGVSLFSNTVYSIIAYILMGVMFIAAVAAIVLVMLTPGNSNGIDALGGSSETFYGKNKGKSTESKLKLWTYICLGVLAVLAIVFFIVLNPVFWRA